MKKPFIIALIVQLSLLMCAAHLEKDNLTITCKTTTQNTKFAYLNTPNVCHIIITNSGSVPCVIDASQILKNKLCDEITIKSIIEQSLRKKHMQKCITHCSSIVVGGIASVFIFFGCDMYHDLWRIANGSVLDIRDIFRMSVLVPPLAMSLFSVLRARKLWKKSKNSAPAYLDYIILSPHIPLVVYPATSVEKIFALEDPTEPLAINSEIIQPKKNFWDDMTKLFSKKK